MQAVRYRPEIDGLRAVAVLSVIIFHLNNRWLPGGFLGVDIFFVISGFLITNIILSEIQNGSFSFLLSGIFIPAGLSGFILLLLRPCPWLR